MNSDLKVRTKDYALSVIRLFGELPNCGEEYVDENITASFLRSAADAAQSGIPVEVRQYSAA